MFSIVLCVRVAVVATATFMRACILFVFAYDTSILILFISPRVAQTGSTVEWSTHQASIHTFCIYMRQAVCRMQMRFIYPCVLCSSEFQESIWNTRNSLAGKNWGRERERKREMVAGNCVWVELKQSRMRHAIIHGSTGTALNVFHISVGFLTQVTINITLCANRANITTYMRGSSIWC